MGNGVIRREQSIQLFFVYEGQRYKKTLKTGGKPMPPTPANLKFADRAAVQIRQQIAFGEFVMADWFPDDSKPTVGVGTTVAARLDVWLQAQRIEASTRKAYESAIKFWKTAVVGEHRLGDMPARAVLLSHVLRALATRPKLSGKTVNNYVSVLREAMELAVEDRVVAVNVVTKVPRARHQKAAPDPFTAAEADLIIADMRAHYPEQVANYVEFKFFTGLRSSEVDALQWRRVDFVAAGFDVVESVVRGVQKSNTKTNVARFVRLNSRALAALQRQRQHTQMAGAHVFHDPRYGQPWADERAFRRSYWEPCLKRIGVRYRPPYNTRHTYATAMLMAGLKPAFCARQMGHSAEIFHSTYARWIDDQRDDAEMDRLEASLAQSSPAVPGEDAARRVRL